MSLAHRILMVDDDPVSLRFTEEILDGRHSLASVFSGGQALTVAPVLRPDLVLLSAELPDMDGLELCHLLRTRRDLHHVKILVLSSVADVSERLRAYRAGADDFLKKPYDPEELLAKLSVLLRVKHVEELDDFKQQILMLLNHEARTPLTAISSCVGMLRELGPLGEDETRELLDTAAEGCERLAALLNRTQLLHEIQVGATEFHMEPVLLSIPLLEAVQQLSDMTRVLNVDVALDRREEPQIVGDAQFLRMAFHAVLHNAIRFSPEGETVQVCLECKGGSAIVSVIDQGPGVDKDYKPFLFDAFVPADIMHHAEGNGLSLAICREILHRHGGFIKLEDRRGQPTCIRISLPVAPTAAIPDSKAGELEHLPVESR